MSLNPLCIIKFFQKRPGLDSLQKICNCCLPVQGSMLKLFQMVLSPDNGPMHLLQKPSHLYCLSLVVGTIVGLPQAFGKLLQGEFHLLQPDWGFAFGTTQVRQIVALIICITFIIENICSRRQIGNPWNICPVQMRSLLNPFRWKANGGPLMCTG